MATDFEAAADAVLNRVVRSEPRVPGVVAMVTDPHRNIYEGAAGKRRLDRDADMTTDTVFGIFSTTKAITGTAALQLVEEGKLDLDAPAKTYVPEIGELKVIEGFDAHGEPKLRTPKRDVTTRMLLLHTAGLGYDFFNEHYNRLAQEKAQPSVITASKASLRTPLLFDPGDKWEYGSNIDWVGRAVEAVSGLPLEVYFRQRIFAPLGMVDTDYIVSSAQRSRLVSVHQRKEDGSLEAIEPKEPAWREFWSGGGGLYSTGRDYLVFLQMLMHQGRFNGAQLLRPQTVAVMGHNQIGDIRAGVAKTAMPERSNDFNFFPGMECKWGLGYMLTPQPGPNGRSAGSLTWAGIFNTYYWLDPQKRIAGVYLTQLLPFADPKALALYGAFESGIYGAAKAA